MSAFLGATLPVVLVDVGRAGREAFFMFWQTLWALVLGFSLSGAVQAFVTRREMLRLLGDHRPTTVIRAALLGSASSSCSYAATAMGRSLFRQGADFLSAVVFTVASTNLVVELGIVLVVLLGWAFLVGEITGGIIMIVLVVAIGGTMIPNAVVERARKAMEPADGGKATTEAPAPRLGERWRDRQRWADAAGYALADMRMVRRELALGYVIAGALAVWVPTSVWHAVFLHGHGVWSDIENALVGPLIAFASFVCSVGNIPLAAALWHGGIGFGGVMSFIFADLITAPLVLIYRRYYGTALTVRLVGLLWISMTGAGLIVQALASATGLVPSARPAHIVALSFGFNATAVLDVIALVALAALLSARRRNKQGESTRTATDPVCGMLVECVTAPARAEVAGRVYWFCSEGCHARFLREPARFADLNAVPTDD